MEILFFLSRLFLGAVFLFFGLNGFFHWRPLPPATSAMNRFNENMVDAKILMPVVKIFEILFGLGLLVNAFPFVCYLALGPIVFFIVLAHVVHNRPGGLKIAAAFLLTYGLLTLQNVHRLAEILR